MTNNIQIISSTEFTATSRGNTFTVWQDVDRNEWHVSVSNAMSRAWNNGYGSFQPAFKSLADIAKKYKTLKDIEAVHAQALEMEAEKEIVEDVEQETAPKATIIQFSNKQEEKNHSHIDNIMEIAKYLIEIPHVREQMHICAAQGISLDVIKCNIENLALGIYANKNENFKDDIFKNM